MIAQLFLFFLLFVSSFSYGASTKIVLEGNVSLSMCEEVKSYLETKPYETEKRVDFILSSSGGNLQSVLFLARFLTKIREQDGIEYTAYIKEQCIGPIALLPLVCHNIVTTPVVSWGAITLQNKEAHPRVLDAEIRALIPPSVEMYEKRAELVHLFVGDVEKPGQVITQHELGEYPDIRIEKKIVSEGFIPGERAEKKEFDRIKLVPTSHVGRIIIRDQKQGISEATYLYVKAAVEAFRETKPACVILELNTPGGEVFASQRISNLLRSLDTQDGIPVIAFVNNWAISAGAMLAYSCRYIVVAPDASMGAATPVFQTPEGMEMAPEKVNSAIRTDFANRAAFFGRNTDLARAMVDPDLLLVKRGNEIVELSSEEEIRKSAYAKDTVITAKGKLLTLTASQMAEYGVADFVVSKEVSRGPERELPNKIALSQTDLRRLPAFIDHPDIVIKTFEMDMRTSIIAFLVSPVVSSLLFFIAVVSIYLELSIPGFGVPGIVGGLALFLILVGSFAQEAITWFEPLCILLGLGLVAIELFVFPMFGIFLVVGGGVALFGLMALLIPGLEAVRFDGQVLNAAGEYVINRVTWLSISLLLALAVIVFFCRRMPLKRLRLSGIVLAETLETPEEETSISVGDEAIVTMTLRPAGKIEREGVLFDAVSSGRFIEKGERVRVMEIHGNIVTVEPLGE
jgi:membrane-bound ClpP family serine protease